MIFRYMEACPTDGQPAYDFENQPGPGIVSHFTQVKIFSPLFTCYFLSVLICSLLHDFTNEDKREAC